MNNAQIEFAIRDMQVRIANLEQARDRPAYQRSAGKGETLEDRFIAKVRWYEAMFPPQYAGVYLISCEYGVFPRYWDDNDNCWTDIADPKHADKPVEWWAPLPPAPSYGRSARDRDGSGGEAGPKDGTHAQPGPKASPKEV